MSSTIHTHAPLRLDRQTCEHSIVSFCLAMVDDDLRFDRDIKTVLLDALSALLCRYQEPDNGTDQPYSVSPIAPRTHQSLTVVSSNNPARNS